MAAAALALSARHRPYSDAEDEALVEVIAAHDKVAAYLTPKLKSVEVSGSGGGPVVLQSAVGDDVL